MPGWSPRGQTPVGRVDAGRRTAGFDGTLNLHTGTETVTRSPEFTASVPAAHLQPVLDAHPDCPIVLLWDRAPWQRGAPIRQGLAAHPRREIIEFPVAAPDLNPQNRSGSTPAVSSVITTLFRNCLNSLTVSSSI